MRKRNKSESDDETGETLKQSASAAGANEESKDGKQNDSTEGGVEIDQVERNRLKKARRKDRKKEKAKERRETAEAVAKKVKLAKEEAHKRLQAIKNEKKTQQGEEQRLQEADWVDAALGVKYQDVVVGKGPIVEDRKQIRVKYKLRAKSFQGGKVIDSSHNHGFRLGRGEVIKGWDIGLAGMKHGGRRRIVVPHQAGYGVGIDVGAGKGGLLYFDVTVHES